MTDSKTKTCIVITEGMACGRPVHGRDWCQTHYGRWQRTGDVMADKPIPIKYDGPCIGAKNCDRPVVARKLCTLHYGRWQSGTPLDQPVRVVEYRSDRESRPGFYICTSCDKERPAEEFDGGRLQCRTCRNRKSLSYQRKDPRARRDRKLRYKYNKTIEWYDETFALQNGVCRICKKPETRAAKDGTFWLCVDHDHNCCPGTQSCGECVRGLLCRTCNQGIGDFDDDVEVLEAAIEYLNSFEKVSTYDRSDVQAEDYS